MILGISGLYGAGKGEVVDFLAARSFHPLSLSDVIRNDGSPSPGAGGDPRAHDRGGQCTIRASRGTWWPRAEILVRQVSSATATT